MVSEAKGFYSCPNCKSLYHVVRVEAGAETTEHICSGCREPLPPRDGRSILKYFYLRDVTERRRIDPRVEDLPRQAIRLRFKTVRPANRRRLIVLSGTRQLHQRFLPAPFFGPVVAVFDSN
jgi:hypothetical protein